MKKRLFSLLAVAVLAASACSTGTASPTVAPVDTGTPAAATPVVTPVVTSAAGGNLIVGLDGDMVFADPSLVSDGNSLYVAAQVVEGLVGLKPGTISEVIPVLASALPTVSADGKVYTFTLRTGVKFQDGSPFNAAAVK